MDTLMEYKCPCCGGKVEFDSSLQKMKCPYCDTTFDVEALKERDEELAKEPEAGENWQTPQQEWDSEEAGQFNTYTCKSCGGEILTDSTTVATHCPYCGNPVIMTGQLSGGLRPEVIIPFQLDKKAAKEALRKHMSGKKLLPKLFREESHLDEIKGVYVPFWLFDAETDSDGHFTATRSRHWSDSNYNYTETSYYSVNRGGQMNFANIPVDSASKIPDELMETIEPFDIKESKPFQTAYMSGYMADRYDVDEEKSEKRANERIEASVKSALEDSVRGYEAITSSKVNVRMKNARARYAMYPVWLMSTTYKGENFLFAMNGQTGKIAGNMPVDRGAWFKWYAIYGAAFSVGLCALWAIIGLFL